MGIFALKANKWHLLYRISLMGLVYSEQAIVQDYLATFFNASCIVLDCTEGLGDSIAYHLINEKEVQFKGKEYNKRVLRAKFNEKMSTGYLQDADGNFIIENGERVELREHVDEATWRFGLSMFREKRLVLPNDEDLRSQFAAELAAKGQNKFIFTSPIPNHIVSMFKCFFYAENQRFGKKIDPKSKFLGMWVDLDD